jgi:hypothetical protein
MYLMPLLAYLRVFPESGDMMAAAGDLSRYYAVHSVRESFTKTTPAPLENPRR